MSLYFGLSFRFLDLRFHGQGDGGEPEWPPSPLRAFQALVIASARMERGRIGQLATEALKWLEGISAEMPPVIIAPPATTPDLASPGYCLSVPNNAMDIVAKAWCRENYSNKGGANPATHRTMKTVRPTHLRTDDAIHYLWSLPDPLPDKIQHVIGTLVRTARNISALGWGIDMVVGDGAIVTADQAETLTGERWLPSIAIDSEGLRVPVPGTLSGLTKRYEGFLKRLEGNRFTPLTPLSTYTTFNYRRAIDPPPRSVATFSLLSLDASNLRAFDTVKWALTVVGMIRHATRCAAQRSGWKESEINTFILGHGESRAASRHIAVGNRRFAYLPLPSIEPRGQGKTPVVGNVRRVMLTAFGEGCEREIAWARQALSGQLLEIERGKQAGCAEGASEPLALLSPLPKTDSVIKSYRRSSTTWATVTPLVLPGYDDPNHYHRRLKAGTKVEEQRRLLGHLSKRIDGLIRKAITQAGFNQILAKNAEIEWCKVGYWRGVDLVDYYGVPDHLKQYPRYHVMIQWRDEQHNPVKVPGPICLGGGRFFGLGLLGAVDI